MDHDSFRPMTGKCQCGYIRYEITAAPYITIVCHCIDCQKLSATSFSITMAIQASSFRLLSGQLKSWERKADSGARAVCYFCPDCGNRIYHLNPQQPEILRFKPGTLDDTRSIRPTAHVWTKRKQSWVVIPKDVPQFATQPDDLGAFVKAGGNRE